MRFFRMSLREVQDLDGAEFDLLWQAITPLEAQETLLGFRIALFPHLKNPQSKFDEKLREAYPSDVYSDKKEYISPEQLAEMLHR